MCNRYVSPGQADIERFFEIGRRNPVMPWPAELYPRAPGPFVRLDREGRRELAVGRWGLIPHFAKSPDIRYSTNNARSEELAEKPTYRTAWARGQRCIIPAVSFDEPNWETGRNVWWRFRRADGEPWGLAGLWNAWIDRATGEIHESYTMLTINADGHPLMGRMHKLDPALPPDAQDKRSVIPIERANVETWLAGSTEDARALMRVPAVEMFEAGPVAAAPRGGNASSPLG
ncbi:SOS response-associated peptidase [Quisquiliibacterium transsilvanicum]|uniref:Abasic site processing protein n=1 Tax=Quisquiliibacterium transsilvanicum TaxID=1549638 RepID=A0A7W8HGM6_9BURK|nr:SOS response-associated peptidase family protein [Quisquiliibacterium transsilvanicum]MBB5271477.1 putative SOS response-associated peptidase YedK [Quisquiliibacterium transsilvanicum]